MLNHLFKKKDPTPLSDFKDVHVKLPVILGVRPGVYLMVIYGILILLVIYLLFFMPGLRDAGTYFNFTSEPLPAGVWVDGKKAGVTPCEILIKEGAREITVRRPFFKPITLQRDVSRSVFALPFLPKREYVDVSLEVADLKALADNAFQEFSEWTLVEGFSTEYPYPPLLTLASQGIQASPNEAAYRVLHKLLEHTLPSAGQPQPAADWLRAWLTIESRGRALLPGAMFRMINTAREYIRTHENLPFFIYSVLPKDLRSSQQRAQDKTPTPTRDSFGSTAGFNALASSYRNYILTFRTRTGARPGGNISLGGLTFLPVPDGDYVMGKNEKDISPLNPDFIHLFPHPVRVKGFFMARTEVTNGQFKNFLNDNPDWRPSHRAQLAAQELVDEFYLQEWTNDAPPAGRSAYPVTHVSAYAAEAYCAWLSTRLRTVKPGFTVRLPSEAEWEWAAAGGDPARFRTPGSRLFTEASAGARFAGTSSPNVFGLTDMAGNVEELCRDWFAKSASLLSSSDPANNPAAGSEPYPQGGQKAVRGGSWATPAAGLEVYRRASQPPYFCNAFLGFRPVIAEQ